MSWRFEFRPYQRVLRQPLQTSHGIWAVREGIVVQLTDEQGRVGYGEAAPLPWFGSEDYAAALRFCEQLPAVLDQDMIFAIAPIYPACQMALESAWEEAQRIVEYGITLPPSRSSILLPAAHQALDELSFFWQQGYRTFKYKIGVASLAEEQHWVGLLAKALAPDGKLRLDANGGLKLEEAGAWLPFCDRLHIEFLEQPLPVSQFEAMLQLAQSYRTPLALDESVATVQQLEDCAQRGWDGIFVIKPAIAGSLQQLRAFCQNHRADLVFSSALETPIGRQVALQLAAEFQSPDRALGFGTAHWFVDDWDALSLPDLWRRIGREK